MGVLKTALIALASIFLQSLFNDDKNSCLCVAVCARDINHLNNCSNHTFQESKLQPLITENQANKLAQLMDFPLVIADLNETHQESNLG